MSEYGSELPLRLYTAAQVRELDRVAIEEQGIPGFTLMRRAGRALFECLRSEFGDGGRITIFCGTGNNGGDGYVVATLARQCGLDVAVVQVGDSEKIRGAALQARQLAQQDGVPISAFAPNTEIADGVVVDALLGTGLSGDVRGDSAAAIAAINDSGLPVLAVDIPSGLCSDRGVVLGAAVRADCTVTFIGVKRGLLTASAPDYTGTLYFADLEVPDVVFAGVDDVVDRLQLDVLSSLLPPRLPSTHKGHCGHVLVVGGDTGMAGAALMAAQAAGRSGAGLVSCATRPENVAAIVSRCPEVMARPVSNGQQLQEVLERASVVVIGPGLGREPWGEQMLQRVLHSSLPLVVDADALNIVSAGQFAGLARRDNWIITPHPGEAGRLLGCSAAQVQQDRFSAAVDLQRRYGGAVVLKGVGTLVADTDHDAVGLCPYGNPGMASGGMGDVLSGVLGGLLAQGLSVGQAARLGVCIHACAADLASGDGIRGLLATDLLPFVRQLVN